MKWDYIEFNGKHPKATRESRVYSDSPDPSWVDYGVRYPEGYLKVDIDDRDHKTGALEDPIKGKPRSAAVVELLQALNIHFTGIQTDHGVHLIFKAPDPEHLARKNKQNWISLINVKMEWKFPESDDHIPLQINGIERKIFSDEADPDTLPEALQVTAMADGEIMAVEHTQYPVYGLQFHPESILTPKGIDILRNIVESTRK